MSRPLRVLVAPDSFKGTATAAEVADALARGWHRERPRDELVLLPQADGGEGTADAIAAAVPGATWRDAGPVTGPVGTPVPGRWVQLPDGTAVVELAQSSGLPLLDRFDPMNAGTRGLGEVVRAALAAGAGALCVTLGGSASTDGGAGALTGLGALLLDSEGSPLPPGGAALAALDRIDLDNLVAAPEGGVELLVDTRAVLTGPAGAAQVFGPQKGADAAQIEALDAALGHFAEVVGAALPHDPDRPGTGAAGGAGYGLGAWGGRIVDGAARIADLTGLTATLPTCDVLVTGEGCYDRTSATGKVVGSLLDRAREHGLRTVVVAGRLEDRPPDLGLDLTAIAGSRHSATRRPRWWLRQAAAAAARGLGAARA
ncbi:glycerate kinase [Pseudonocardia ailaonensis]|uniref:Glycerate kinase n=1 Tax=Pseudonocardia ailaonensis TaxID=367279 RepID=A0ABN2NC68_9PSEU